MSTTPERIGKYELQKQLGRGSVGEVWKGFDLQLRRDIAIKLIHPDLQSDPNFMTRFSQEGQAITVLQHPNLVQIREAGITRPAESGAATAYLVMDYVEGQTLAEYIRHRAHDDNFPAIEDIATLFSSLGAAVDYLHQNGVIHGNITPANILLKQQGGRQFTVETPLLSDFANSKLFGEHAPATPFYLAPEQAKGQSAIPQSDVYALGVILYELCTGVVPFRGESPVAVMMQHINILPTPPALINASVPAALSEVIVRALAKDPATRYPTASLLAAAITDACPPAGEGRKEDFQRALAMEHARRTDNLGDERANSRPLGVSSILGVPVNAPVPGTFSTPTPSTSFPALSTGATTTGARSAGNHGAAEAGSRVSAPLPTVKPASAPSGPLASPPLSPRIEPKTGPIPQWNAPAADTQRLSFPMSERRPPAPTVVSAPLPLPPPAFPPAAPSLHAARRRSMRPFYLVSATLLLILGIILGIVMIAHPGSSSQSVVAHALVGHVFFQDDALGHDDTLHIQLQGLPDPVQGQMYAAWLELQNGQIRSLGRLSFTNGSINQVYGGDSSHTNLVSIAQGFAITLENIGSSLQAPAGAIIYEGRFEQVSLPYIKNLLYRLSGFPGNEGIVASMLDTLNSINDKTGSIVDTLQGSRDYGLVWRQAIRIIQLIDGSQYASTSGDLPAKDPGLLSAPVGLLSSPAQSGYLDAIAQQASKIYATSHDATTRQHAQNIQNAITDLRGWVQSMRQNDIQLLRMIGQPTPAMSATPPSPAMLKLALQLQQASTYAYTGRTIPPNESPLPILGSAGATQAYSEAQYLATLDIRKV